MTTRPSPGLRRCRRAAVTALVALLFPLVIAFGMLAVDGARMYRHYILVQQTAQAASLAGANRLTSYYTSGNSSATIVATAQQFAQANMPVATYGNVVPASDVVLGNWDPTARTFTTLQQSGGTAPNAVRVTARSTAANGNALQTLFGTLFNKGTVNVTTSAISSYATGKAFHVILVNDLSSSFSSSIANQRAADQAILDCVKTSAGPTSVFGIVGFTGYALVSGQVTQPPLVVNSGSNYTTLQNKIASLNSCGKTGAPPCSGSNVAAGIYQARKIFTDASYADTNRNIVIITDGVPNANSINYTVEEGKVTTTPNCTTNCTDAQLWTWATSQANTAGNLGINISTIYYTGNTSASQVNTYANQLAQLKKGTGVSLLAPTQSQISSIFAAFCATMSSKLMAVQ